MSASGIQLKKQTKPKSIFVDLTNKSTILQNEMMPPNSKYSEDANEYDHSTTHNVVSFFQMGENSTETGNFYTYSRPKKQTKLNATFVDKTDKTKLRNEMRSPKRNFNDYSKEYNWSTYPRLNKQTKTFIDLTNKKILQKEMMSSNSKTFNEYANYTSSTTPKVASYFHSGENSTKIRNFQVHPRPKKQIKPVRMLYFDENPQKNNIVKLKVPGKIIKIVKKPYKFKYNVETEEEGEFNHKEISDGDKTEGQFEMKTSDVKYKTTYSVVPGSGFQAMTSYSIFSDK